MREVQVKLNTVSDVKEFVGIVTFFDCDFDIVAERYVVDAKSIMGIFSLDLSKNLTLIIKTDSPDEVDLVTGKISKFIVE